MVPPFHPPLSVPSAPAVDLDIDVDDDDNFLAQVATVKKKTAGPSNLDFEIDDDDDEPVLKTELSEGGEGSRDLSRTAVGVPLGVGDGSCGHKFHVRVIVIVVSSPTRFEGGGRETAGPWGFNYALLPLNSPCHQVGVMDVYLFDECRVLVAPHQMTLPVVINESLNRDLEAVLGGHTPVDEGAKESTEEPFEKASQAHVTNKSFNQEHPE